jgi:hypothetical protein
VMMRRSLWCRRDGGGQGDLVETSGYTLSTL